MKLDTLKPSEHLAFFVNLHNLLMVDALIRYGSSPNLVGRVNFAKSMYIIGGSLECQLFLPKGIDFTLLEIEHAIIRGNNFPSAFVGNLFG